MTDEEAIFQAMAAVVRQAAMAIDDAHMDKFSAGDLQFNGEDIAVDSLDELPPEVADGWQLFSKSLLFELNRMGYRLERTQ